GKDEWVDGISGIDNYMEAPVEALRDKILAAGIVGLGGATFPTHVKLSPPKEKKVECVILNGCECEPYLTADHRLMLESPEDIVEGLRILMRILSVDKGYIGIEDNKPDAIAKMTEAAKKYPNITVTTHLVKYPQGAEKQLIKAALNREVPSGGLPMDVGVVVQNVGTAAAIYQAVKSGRPLIERIVTVTGQGVKEPKNLKVRIGTLLRDLIDDCGGFDGTPGKVVAGGPMMGQAQWTIDVPAIKGTSGVLVFPDSSVMAYELNPNESTIEACIRCGECVRHCPMMLNPSSLSIYGELDMLEDSEKGNVFDCIECGVCTFVCPAKRPLMHLIRYSKNLINAKRQKK
ncbi:MAG: electron transport complex subunit RsxC, partial [Nitrospirota bacterium]|nr:electron transport complex subunit RsxC [Nitrospirota bacterium]